MTLHKNYCNNFVSGITIYVIFIKVCSSKQFFYDNENHNLDTRQRNNLYLPQANLTIHQKGTYYSEITIFNNLPLEIKNVAGNKKKKK
jgi:hypothetical protein